MGNNPVCWDECGWLILNSIMFDSAIGEDAAESTIRQGRNGDDVFDSILGRGDLDDSQKVRSPGV